MKGSFKFFLILAVLVSTVSLANSKWGYVIAEKFSVVLLNEVEPVADFEFSPDGECSNESIQFTNLSTGTNISYLWDFGDGNESTEENPTYTYNATGGGIRNFTVRLTVTDEDDVSVSVSKVVTVQEIPSLAVGSDQDQTTFDGLQYYIVCENEPSEFTFYNQAGGSEKNIEYEIDWGDGSEIFRDSDWTTLTHTYSIGIYRLTYTVTPENGCKVSRQFGVFIGSNPAVGLGNPGNTNVCIGETLTFPISGTENNPDGTVYTVTFSDGSTPQVFTHPPPETVSHVFTSTSCGTESDGFQNSFSVKIVAENPCAVSQASVVPIYVSEPPIPLMQISEDVACVDQNVQIRNVTDFNVEVSNNGECNSTKRFVWEIEPMTGWSLQSGSSLGSRPNPDSPNSWVSGSETLVPRFSEPGTYTIKLITGNRCGIQEETETICVIPEPKPSFELSETVLCESGEIQVTNTSNVLGACGGSSDLFTWSVSYENGNCGTGADWDFINGTNQNSENPELQFLSPGIYDLTLTINSSCGVFRETQEIVVSSPPIVEIENLPDGCGSATINPTANIRICDDSSPTYLWTFEDGIPASSTEEIPGEIEFSSSGNKKITLEVTTSCGSTIAESIFTIAEPPIVDAGMDTEFCNGEEVQLNASVSGGSGNYSILWTADPPTEITGGDTFSPIVKPNVTTIFTATITDEDTGCLEEDSVEIIVFPAPTISFDLPNQEICSGEETLEVEIITDPTGEITSWIAEPNGVAGVIESGTNTIPVQTLINTGETPVDVVYTVEITDPSQGDCNIIPAEYIIRVNPVPEYQKEDLEICSGDSFSFVPTGNIAGSEFTWVVSAPTELQGATPNDVPAPNISQQLTNLSNAVQEAVYTISPSLGACSGETFELIVKVAPSPAIEFSEDDQNICTGDTTIAVMLSSDVDGASFSWTAAPQIPGLIESGTGPEIPAMTLENSTSSPIEVKFEVLVDSNSGVGSCSGTPRIYTITVNPEIAIQPIVPDFNGFEISCFGANDGSIDLNVSGGNGQYSIDWTGPGGFTAQTELIQDLAPGIYQVEIADDFSCSLIRSFTIKEPPAIEVTIGSKVDVLCAGEATGSILLNITGGVNLSGYDVSWTQNGDDFPDKGEFISELEAGDYQPTIMDSNGCTLTLSPITITEPANALIIEYTKTDISCYGANDGSLELNVSGGAPPYDIQWTFGSEESIFDNLGPGDYTLTVSDQSGCTKTETITIEDAPLFKIDPDVMQPSCFGNEDGSIVLNLEGGVGAYTIRWDDGEELEDRFNLAPGNYGVTIKDETDCEIRSEFNLVEPALLETEPKVTDALDCDNPSSGSISLGIKGGTPPYMIEWSNGSTDENLISLGPGQYAVEITDSRNCTISQVFEVKRPPTLSIIGFQSSNVQCEPREITEEIRIVLTGGVAPYTINWSGGTVSEDGKTMTTDQPGFYQVEVLDGNGCITTESFEVKNFEVVPATEIKSVAFDQYNSYLVNFEIQFWNRSFGEIVSYYWDFGDGEESFEENPIHKYAAEGDYKVTLTVTDIFGCSLSKSEEISVLDYYLVVPDAFTPNGDGINDYFFPQFVGIESLEFWVLNKWGETVYYTDDMQSAGWDGTINGEIGIPGNYVYKVVFNTLDGRKQTQTDLFLLLK